MNMRKCGWIVACFAAVCGLALAQPAVTVGGYSKPVDAAALVGLDGAGAPVAITLTDGRIPVSLGNVTLGGGGISGNNTNSPVSVVAFAALPSATFTRPADTTQYAVGDLVANSTTAGSVAPMQFTVARIPSGTGMIRRVRLRKSGTSLTAAQFRVHFYNAAPTPSNGDNGAWLTNGAASYMGAIDVVCDRAFTDGAGGNGVPIVGSELNFALASGQVVWALLEARAAYTPVSGESFTILLETLQN